MTEMTTQEFFALPREEQLRIGKQRMDEARAAALGASRVVPVGKTPHIPPIVSNDDPPNSHLAAERVEPSRESKRGQVLALLRNERWRPSDGWVAAEALREVGGSEALRRVRELRQMGHDIEARPVGATAWEYRLVESR